MLTTQAICEGTDPNTSLVALIQSMVSTGSTFNQSPLVSNLFGSSVYGLKGSTGSKIGGNVSGSGATGTTSRFFRSGTGDAAVLGGQVIDGARSWQNITITSGGNAFWSQFSYVLPAQTGISTGALPASSWGRLYVHMSSGLDLPVGNVLLTLNFTKADGTTNALSVQAGAIDTNQYNSALATPGRGRGDYWLATNPFQMPADGDYPTAQVSLTIYFWGAAVGATTFAVKISDPILRIVPDPRTAWNLT